MKVLDTKRSQQVINILSLSGMNSAYHKQAPLLLATHPLIGSDLQPLCLYQRRHSTGNNSQTIAEHYFVTAIRRNKRSDRATDEQLFIQRAQHDSSDITTVPAIEVTHIFFSL